MAAGRSGRAPRHIAGRIRCARWHRVQGTRALITAAKSHAPRFRTPRVSVLARAPSCVSKRTRGIMHKQTWLGALVSLALCSAAAEAQDNTSVTTPEGVVYPEEPGGYG